jgi:pilus assembly protein CpaE
MLGMRPRFNFVDLVQNFHRLDADLLASFIERHDSGVDLLSAPYHPEKAEMVSGDLIRRILVFLRQHYDYIVVDTSKSFSQATLATFEQSDQVFLVTTADLPSLRNIQRGLPMMRKVLIRGEDQLRLIINRFDNKDQISVKDIERSLGLKVFWKLSNDYEAVLGSLNTGKPIVMNGNSSYSKDLKSLGVALAGTEVQGERRGRFLGALSRLTAGKKKDGKTHG